MYFVIKDINGQTLLNLDNILFISIRPISKHLVLRYVDGYELKFNFETYNECIKIFEDISNEMFKQKHLSIEI